MLTDRTVLSQQHVTLFRIPKDAHHNKTKDYQRRLVTIFNWIPYVHSDAIWWSMSQAKKMLVSAGLSFLVGGELVALVCSWAAYSHYFFRLGLLVGPTTSKPSPSFGRNSSHFCWLGRLNKLKLLYGNNSARDDLDQPPLTNMPAKQNTQS